MGHRRQGPEQLAKSSVALLKTWLAKVEPMSFSGVALTCLTKRGAKDEKVQHL